MDISSRWGNFRGACMSSIPPTKLLPTAAAASVRRRRWTSCAKQVSGKSIICTAAFSPGPRKWIHPFHAIKTLPIDRAGIMEECPQGLKPRLLRLQMSELKLRPPENHLGHEL